jgi:hypothetical protein
MGDHLSDAATPHQDQHRSTNQGRLFGDISYPAEEQPPAADDLRRRASLGIRTEVVDQHWTERPSRSTGARRRFG